MVHRLDDVARVDHRQGAVRARDQRNSALAAVGAQQARAGDARGPIAGRHRGRKEPHRRGNELIVLLGRAGAGGIDASVGEGRSRADLQGAQLVGGGAGDEEQIAVARLRDREAGRADEVAARRRNDRAAAGGQGRAERKQPLHGQLPARPRSAASQGWSIGTSTKATLQSPKTLTASLAVPAGAGKSLRVKGTSPSRSSCATTARAPVS